MKRAPARTGETKTNDPRTPHFGWVVVVAGLVAASSLVLGSMPTALADPARPCPAHCLTVVTYNVYQGSELQEVILATSALQFLKGVAIDYGHVQQNNFTARAAAIASQVATVHPDLIGLQEVARWQTSAVSPTCAPFASTTDYQQQLLNALAAQGVPYTLVGNVTNFDVQGTGLFPCGFMNVRLTDHNVILARSSGVAHGALQIVNVQAQNFVHNFAFSLLGHPITILEGWVATDVSYQGSTVRLVITHLDANSQAIRVAQAAELVNGPMNTPLPVILAGDLNSVSSDPAPGVISAAGFTDQWPVVNSLNPGYTASQTAHNGTTVDVINNTVSYLNQRIDYVWVNPPLFATGMQLIGNSTASMTPGGLWPSDHAGLACTVVLR